MLWAVWTTLRVVQAGTVHSPSDIALLLGFSLHALAEAVRLTNGFQDVGTMREPVEQRLRHLLLGQGQQKAVVAVTSPSWNRVAIGLELHLTEAVSPTLPSS